MDVIPSVITRNITASGNQPELRVSEFYRNAVVLITGGTGFMGKVLVEKLLRSFDVKKIFLLVREKRGVTPFERLQKMKSDPIFETIKKTAPHPDKILAKLEAIDTDIMAENFVKDPYKTLILNETQIVFHLMASIRFDQDIRSIFDTNVRFTERLCTFLRNAPRLQSVVYVSTFYSNCDRSHIKECVYDNIRYGGYENIQRIIEPLSDSELAELTPKIITPMPNTYGFSKKCTELMIQRRFADLPIGIFRPPIVGSGYQEPVPGWLDCIQGVTAVCIPLLEKRTMWYNGNPSSILSIVPVDYCIAAILTSACDIRARYEENRVRETPDRQGTILPVYNYYFDKHPVSWKNFFRLVGSGLPTATERLLRPFRVQITRWRLPSLLCFWLWYFLAYINDFFLALFCKPTRNVRNVSALQHLVGILKYYTMYSWTGQNDNMKRMRSLLSKDDEPLLEFDVDRIEWKDYFKHFTRSINEELLRKKIRRRQRKKIDI